MPSTSKTYLLSFALSLWLYRSLRLLIAYRFPLSCSYLADKLFVLEHPHALDDLITALLLDEINPRRTQDGADELQATAAHALENLALSEVGKAPLREHAGVMEGLRALKKDAMSDAARQSASAALFELRTGRGGAAEGEGGPATVPRVGSGCC